MATQGNFENQHGMFRTVISNGDFLVNLQKEMLDNLNVELRSDVQANKSNEDNLTKSIWHTIIVNNKNTSKM